MSHPIPGRDYNEGETKGEESGHPNAKKRALDKFHPIKGPKKFPKLKMTSMFKKKSEVLKKLLKDK